MLTHSPLSTALQRLWHGTTGRVQNDRELIESIRAAAAPLKHASDNELAGDFIALREQVQAGSSLTSREIIQPAFALLYEAARRALSIDLYNVQLLAGLALARGGIAQMQTGEGKTFSALLPAGLHALAGNGVHVMTVNAYLAERDYQLMAPVYRLLGLTVGRIAPEVEPDAKRAAYQCDVTYGLGCEFGFDYLRDQVALMTAGKPRLGEGFRGRLRGQALQQPDPMQRGHAVAIVDEADSVMIDEANTPLVLAIGGNRPAPNAPVYRAALQAAAQLESDIHFTLDPTASSLQITPQGSVAIKSAVQATAGRGLSRPWQTYVEQALRAEHFYRADVHYVVRDGEIQIVDQYTGRIFTDRSWREGLQQAVQAKEGVPITIENQSIARITRQRFFRRYGHLCGMTGTAQGIERDLRRVYGVRVTVIPPHRPCRRIHLPLRAFANCDLKDQAIVNEVDRLHAIGQPVLIGTAAIETSLRLAALLTQRGIDFQLLNGMQDAEEAAIVARAGTLKAVTIATNMAGRGTDIKLSAPAEAAGGLHVILSQPQESARVDRQLIGRAARQGDPGAAQMFVAADDPLFTRYNPALSRQLERLSAAEGELPESAVAQRGIARTQKSVEAAKAQHRQQMFAHDDWLESVLSEIA